MRDALIITISLIGLFLLIGYVYNAMSPYFVKLGVLESEYAATSSDGGIFRSNDFGRSWSQLSGDLTRSKIFSMEFQDAYANTLTVAASSGLHKSEDRGDTWRLVASGVLSGGEAVSSFAIDPQNSQRIYIASYSQDKRGRILKSKEEGFYEVYSAISDDDKVLGVWIDSYDTSIIYAGTQRGLFLESNDFGESWKVKREFDEPLFALHMTPSDTRVMYARIAEKIFKTSNRGQSWQDITSSLRSIYGRDFQVEQIAVDPHNERSIYIATSHGLLRSGNGGASFALIELLVAGEEPAVSAVGLDKQIRDVIYIGVDSQIHKSEDGGKSWQIKKLDTARKISVIRVAPDDSSIVFAGVK